MCVCVCNSSTKLQNAVDFHLADIHSLSLHLTFIFLHILFLCVILLMSKSKPHVVLISIMLDIASYSCIALLISRESK
uniref:Uncharacterized protein n=1 Tax=Octopus bimaculoides TaxID=37653 RepID=A0A0L8FSY2_OCTBM